MCGVDEAGRGPVIGPMVIAGICASLNLLEEMGVKDSKKLSPGRREKLAKEIRKIAHRIEIRVVEPEKIDSLRMEMTLNEIEVLFFAEIIDALDCKEVYVDAADVNESRFAENIKSHLKREVKIISRHKADEIYPAVSAASIIAKVERDRRIADIAREIGDFGSGYPADPRTTQFLKDYLQKHGALPPHVRKSWKSVKKLLMEMSQSNLDAF